jgi:hypothetical protein
VKGIFKTQRWLLYALGGGYGHVTRAVALGRRAAASGIEVHLLVNSSSAEHIPLDYELGRQGRVHRFSPHWNAARIRTEVAQYLNETTFDAIVVDCFPRGLAGELLPLLQMHDCPRILVHRDISPRYLSTVNIHEALAVYDLLISPGETGSLCDPQRFPDLPVFATEPWLIRDGDELLSCSAARDFLQVPYDDDRPLILVSASGRPEEQDVFRALASELQDRFGRDWHVRLAAGTRETLSPATVDSRTLPQAASDSAVSGGISEIHCWPLIRVLPGADLLVGAGGYHTVYEARSTGTPLLALPQKRLYDRQSARLTPVERCSSLSDLISRVAHRRCQPRAVHTGNCISGTHAAVQEIRRLTECYVRAT